MDDVIHGHCEDTFDKVRAALADNIASGEEVGACIAIDVAGESVVDMWGGCMDAARTRAWTKDTIVNVWSSTKTVTSLAGLMLVDRGLVELTTPVAAYWPEFAANGKQDIEFRHVLAHTSGVSGWDTPFSTEEMYDWDKSTAALAAQAPWWEPGTASGYHAHNQGHLIGEVMRRVTGRSLKEFVRDEIAGPLGADFQIGARPEDYDRIAEIIVPPPLELPLEMLPEDSPMRKTFSGPLPNAEAANTPAWREADMGALNGHGNARSLATILSAISLGGMARGVQLLKPETVELIFEEQANGVDLVLPAPMRWGIGYGLAKNDGLPYVPDEKICFWGGWGGSMVLMCPDRRTTIAYVMNKMGPGILGSDRMATYGTLIFDALGVSAG
ncbi:serine hydrolase domain-containing protein [Mycobacterium sp.]|uniref:serine hydrolase domain-containing protein n=1 Tax=Mycobacterium sp. TaxID=1785 RepID=UPI002B7D586F|nr:serine hydrolase domain-containing protein [Mycobacterium sp.]HTQ22605.1 serine hydrolase domain-containing protein [Mycobacterium sp.]